MNEEGGKEDLIEKVRELQIAIEKYYYNEKL